MKNAITRNPKGVTKEKPIALRLKRDERLAAERLASEKNITLSALARDAFLAGLPLIAKSMLSATSPDAGISSSGNASTAAPFTPA